MHIKVTVHYFSEIKFTIYMFASNLYTVNSLQKEFAPSGANSMSNFFPKRVDHF